MDQLLQSSIAGAAGGLAWFLVGLKFARIKNNKHFKKGTLEMLGGTLVGTFIAVPLLPIPQYTVSFLAGAAWSEIIQRTRSAITKHVEDKLAE